VQAGVRIIHNAAPVQVIGNGRVEAVEFAYTEDTPEG
jgi:dihydropyrimidine dehydrogenase (NAD+) subunit PreT